MKKLSTFVVLFYLLGAFPFSYFRHDDWLILGNAALHLPQDWAFALRPSLFFLEEEVVWFFRPLFKVFVYLFFHIFGYQYYLWLASLFVITVIGFVAMSKVITMLNGSVLWGRVFLLFSAASVHLHFGSLVWVGEGMMNCPQLLFLSLCTYYFVKAVLSDSNEHWKWQLSAAVTFFVLSLCIKESSVLHTGFLFLLLICEPKLRSVSAQRRLYCFVPVAVLSALFLFVRLGLMEVNPAYRWTYATHSFFRTLGYFLSALVAPILIFYLSQIYHRSVWLKQFTKQLTLRFPYVLLLCLSIFPYLGLTDFFSPGWLLMPSFYLFMILGLSGYGISLKSDWRQMTFASWAILLICGGALTVKLLELGWWKWHQPQRMMKQIVASQNDRSISEVKIFECVNDQYHGTELKRVVGFHASLHQMWNLHHKRSAKISILPCDSEAIGLTEESDVLRLEYRFPYLKTLTKS